MTRNSDTAKQWAIALGFVAFVLAQDERRDAAIDAAESGRYP